MITASLVMRVALGPVSKSDKTSYRKILWSLEAATLAVWIILSFFFCFFFITKSFPFFPPAPALSTISKPLSSSMCSITPATANVGSSYNRMRGPGIGCWFSDRSNCSHWSLTLTFTLTNENLSLLVFVQLCSPRCWHLDSNYLSHRFENVGSSAAEVPVKFQSNRTILNTKLVASRLHETLR